MNNGFLCSPLMPSFGNSTIGIGIILNRLQINAVILEKARIMFLNNIYLIKMLSLEALYFKRSLKLCI